MERSQWEVEKAELQARIAFLQGEHYQQFPNLEQQKYITWTNLGERKGQENLKNDLVRRIKMLEYALKQVFPVDPTN